MREADEYYSLKGKSKGAAGSTSLEKDASSKIARSV